MPDKNDEAPALSSSLLLDELKDEVARVAGMCAETVTQTTRLVRLIVSNQTLDGRSKQAFTDLMARLERTMNGFAESQQRSFARMTPEEIAAAFDRPRIDAARRILREAEESGTELVRRKKDDSITLKVTIPTGEAGKKHRRHLIVTAAKALAAAAAGAIIRHLVGG